MALKHVAGAARGGIKNAVDKVEHLLIAMVLVAAILIAGSHGWAKGAPAGTLWGLVLAMTLIAVVGFEFRAAKKMMASWFERHAGSLVGWGVLWLACAGGTLITSYGTASVNNNKVASVQKAAYTAYDDVSKSKGELEIAVGRLEKELAELPVARAEGAIANAIVSVEQTKPFLNSNNCTDITTRDRRTACQSISNLRSEMANSKSRVAKEEKISSLKADLRNTRKQASTTEVVLSEESANIEAIAYALGVSKETARRFDAMSLTFLIQIMLTLGAMLFVIESYSGKPRKPWFNWSKLWDGGSPEKAVVDRAEEIVTAPQMALAAPAAPAGPSSITNLTVMDSRFDDIVSKLRKLSDQAAVTQKAAAA